LEHSLELLRFVAIGIRLLWNWKTKERADTFLIETVLEFNKA
jgi:hypothetical protein